MLPKHTKKQESWSLFQRPVFNGSTEGFEARVGLVGKVGSTILVGKVGSHKRNDTPTKFGARGN